MTHPRGTVAQAAIDRQAAKVARLMRSWQWRRVWLASLRLRLMRKGLR